MRFVPCDRTRGVGEIAGEIENAGGDINAWTSYDQTVYHVVLGSSLFDVGLDILSDAIQNSSFDAEELARELEVILEEIKRSEDQPASRVSRTLFEAAFQEHPYRRPVIGRSEVVAEFSRDNVTRFYDAHYRAERLCIVAVGDIDADDALARIETSFGSVQTGARPMPERPKEPKQHGLRCAALEDDVEETHLAIGFVGPSILDDDLAAADVLSVLLGQGESSRLSLKVRREAELVNEVYAYAYTPRDAGLFVLGASLRHERLAEAVDAIALEVAAVRNAPPDAAEVQKAQTILCSESIYQRETVEGLARRLGFWTTMTGKPDWEDEYERRVRAVTTEDVQRVARKVLCADGVNLVTLTPTGASDVPSPEDLGARFAAALLEPDENAKAERPSTKSRNGRITRVELSSGATLIVEPNHTNPIVAVRAVWLGGVRGELLEHSGHAHLMSELVTRGTQRRSAREIAAKIDAMAGHLDLCPVAEELPIEVESKARAVEGVRSARVDLVWDPPWTMEMMSEAAKLELGML